MVLKSTLRTALVKRHSTSPSGSLTPVPCVPNTPSPWHVDNPLVVLDGEAALTSESTCQCQWGGEISVSDPANKTEVG